MQSPTLTLFTRATLQLLMSSRECNREYMQKVVIGTNVAVFLELKKRFVTNLELKFVI
jgi:hypothetical protein